MNFEKWVVKLFSIFNRNEKWKMTYHFHFSSSKKNKLELGYTHLACFCVLMNFSAKSCKKCLISWKTMRNQRFGQKFQLFEETGMFLRFDELFSKKLQKVPHFVKEHEKSSIWPKHSTFRTNWHVFLFWWTFQQKVARSASFREKPWKIIDLAKPWHSSNKLACFSVLINISGKSGKKCLISWKSLKNHRFGQNTQLFQQTGMFFCFDELFSKKLEKVPDFVKIHEKSSIWPKLDTFRTNRHVFVFWSTFQPKLAKRASFR